MKEEMGKYDLTTWNKYKLQKYQGGGNLGASAAAAE